MWFCLIFLLACSETSAIVNELSDKLVYSFAEGELTNIEYLYWRSYISLYELLRSTYMITTKINKKSIKTIYNFQQ